MKTLEVWDEEKTYDERIFPLMAEIIAICKEHRIPMVASFAYRNDDEDTSICTTHLPFDGRTVESFKEAHRAIFRRHSMLAITISGPSRAADESAHNDATKEDDHE